MPKITKKEIRLIIDNTIANVLNQLKINPLSKKTKKGFAKVSKELSKILKNELKRKGSKSKGSGKIAKGKQPKIVTVQKKRQKK